MMFSSWPPCRQGLCSIELCCSPLGLPVARGWLWLSRPFNSSFLSSLLSRYILYQQSPTPSMFCSCSPISSHFSQISLYAVLPSHSRSSSLPFGSTFWASDLFASFHLPFFTHDQISSSGMFSYPLCRLPCVRADSSLHSNI